MKKSATTENFCNLQDNYEKNYAEMETIKKQSTYLDKTYIICYNNDKVYQKLCEKHTNQVQRIVNSIILRKVEVGLSH